MSDSDVSEFSVDLSDFSDQISEDNVSEVREILEEGRGIEPYRFEPYDSYDEEVEVSGDEAAEGMAAGPAQPTATIDLDIGRLQNIEW